MDEGEIFAWAAARGLDPEILAQLVDALRPDGGDAREVAAPTHLRRIGSLGQGGTAEVWLAHDDRFDRQVAMKVLAPELAHHAVARERFLREARATARLVHPGIVPVHEIGELPDGRPFFTMAVVRGRTLGEVVAGEGRDRGADHRLVELLRRAVDAVAYAHGQGVVHRDLKPRNVMVGPFGTVFVLDWGLVRWTDDRRPAGAGGAADDGLTLVGAVSGTPGWMSPEQACGDGELGPASDVFSLGLMLHHLLHRRPAFDPTRPMDAVLAVRTGAVPPCTEGPDVLREVVARCVALDPADRFPTAAPLADALANWLDGEARRSRARSQVAEARALGVAEAERAAESAIEQALAADRLRGVPPHAPVGAKLAGWTHQDRADALMLEALALSTRRLQALHGALTWDPEHAEALGALADHWRAVHVAAEAVRDEGAAQAAREQLAYYDRGAHAAYLDGRGRITLRTEPPVAGTLSRLVEVDRRYVPVEPRAVPAGPVTVDGLATGSWLLSLGGFAVPVWIGRGAEVALDVTLPDRSALDPDDCFVPGGPFRAGNPGTGFQSLPWREVEVAPFVIRRHPVTHREYLAFLDDLVATGREAEAVALAPHERGARPDQPGPLCYARTADGRWALAPDADGDVWDPDWPVFLVDHAAAEAYAGWWADRTGRPWRLPSELEWEKAARGVDGRSYPWGERFDPSFACVRASHPGRPVPASIRAFPDDVSVYGVRGMAGNLRDWCADPFRLAGAGPDVDPGSQKVLRGGCWYFPESGAHVAARYALESHNRGDTVSFRLARSLVPADLGAGLSGDHRYPRR
ncbi:MAG: bifunctional serine/threonine-protein kinase/formylglycine-generating enzyme family protein [Myxococcota bacterium]